MEEGLGEFARLLELEKQKLLKAGDVITERLADRALDIIQEEATVIETGQEQNAVMNFNRKIRERDGWIVRNDHQQATYSEFGTGIVGQIGGSHPQHSEMGWEHDINRHGSKGWVYPYIDVSGRFNETRFAHTHGVRATPVYYRTAQRLKLEMPKITEEYFKGR